MFEVTDEIMHKILNMYENTEWKKILNLNIDPSNENLHSLLWVWPSLDNLIYIKEFVQKFNLNKVISIGCGSGLFEWLLIQSTRIEVDESWWTSKYAKYKFIPLQFTKMPPEKKLLPKDTALMFCYFNNGTAFKQYIENYEGCLIFIIGPGPGRGTFTNPEPFNVDFGSTDWNLIGHQEVRDTKDFIAVYNRKN